jgi:hypothetical protein
MAHRCCTSSNCNLYTQSPSLAAAFSSLVNLLPLGALGTPQSVALAIQQPQSAEEQAYKVSANDGPIALRTPTNAYLLEKEARAVVLAKASKRSASAKSASHSAEAPNQDLLQARRARNDRGSSAADPQPSVAASTANRELCRRVHHRTRVIDS